MSGFYYIIGGQSNNVKIMNDIYQYDIENNKLEKIMFQVK